MDLEANVLDGNTRLRIINDIDSDENKQRKTVSLAQYEIYQYIILPHVLAYLKKNNSEQTVDEMPIVSTINIAKRIANQEASIYKDPPKREFTGVTDQQKKVLEDVYKMMNINKKMMKSNQYYKLQHQNHIQVIPKKGKLCLRVLLNHHLDSIPNLIDPEMADAYIVSGFDKKYQTAEGVDRKSDATNQVTGDPDDYDSTLKVFEVWSEKHNFLMDGKGNLITQETDNAIKMLPFAEVSPDKDFEYWIRAGSELTDFTIQFNAAMSDLGHIVRMQGFAQAWMKGPSDMIPQNLQIGPSYVIKLPIDKNNPTETDFGFASPNPDLAGSIQYIELLLSAFISSKGVDPKTVSTKGEGQKYASGFERLLALLQMFDASKEDFSTYEAVEQKIFQIVCAYINTYSGKEVLKEIPATVIPKDAKMSITFASPELIESRAEKTAVIKERKEMGLISEIEAIMEDRGVDETAAREIYEKIIEDSLETQLLKKKLNPEPTSSNTKIVNGVKVPNEPEVMDDDEGEDEEDGSGSNN